MERATVVVTADREPTGITAAEAGRWVLVRLGPTWPVECYQVDAEGLEIFRGYLHRAPIQIGARLRRLWDSSVNRYR